ncbi:Bacterial regulatory protein, tetR family [Mycobacteroides franklinii]|uniref:Bacterial regulatory protein, tetR family n=1 Tax=Mycobacteroides franklinii TaxID=948102 RepID=A0A4R8RCW3_9MYCO|nr:Bacterial regulatory protein, tetR family [Mycobacteroides franklinii]TDZ52319.1 Bacterial regulatory protein, tetR family [Mycobacteroides franklinii]TDZ55726.1 Bacterial regulatory protein, tetR family [Mycobacteroides franklinii]TDZ62667.1 Bacterial regulatory protein, tetR family [Mycobacteroides franklinii]TDZ69064.1 Bacterial regulatory protein, tetR family [Mycobacteroides franklinii]
MSDGGDARRERWAQHKVRVRRRFIASAVVAIERKGPSATVEDVVRVAHSAKPKLYRHFEDRNDLFDAVAQAMVAAVRRQLSGAVDMGIPPQQSARRAASRLIELPRRFPQSTRFLFEHQMISVRDRPAPALRPGGVIAELTAAISSFLERVNVHPAGADQLAAALLGTAATTAIWQVAQSDMPDDAGVQRLAEMLWAPVDAFLRSKGVIVDPDRMLDPAGVEIARAALVDLRGAGQSPSFL